MDNQADRAPWTVKGVTMETRQIAKDAANRAGLSVGEWLARAVRQQADRDRGNAVLPPDIPGQPEQPAHAVARYDAGGLPAAPVALDMIGLAAAVRAAIDVSQAATEAPALRGLARDVSGLLRDQVRHARGLSPMGKRKPVAEDEGEPG